MFESSVCKHSSQAKLEFITPDGFYTDWNSGKAAGQYVIRPENIMQTGLVAPEIHDEEQFGAILRCAYQRNGQLLFVNEGYHAGGFTLCNKCGKSLKSSAVKCDAKHYGKPCDGSPIKRVALGHKIETDTLHLRFESLPDFPMPDETREDFWLSLTFALIQGACRALQIERRDLGGVLFPRSRRNDNGWTQTIVLYDDVPGGAGHVRRIKDELSSVLSEALRVVNCVHCAPEISCYHCLRDYNNQNFHSKLKRGEVVRFLELLQASMEATNNQETKGLAQVLAIDPTRWTLQQVSHASKEVWIVTQQIDLERV